MNHLLQLLHLLRSLFRRAQTLSRDERYLAASGDIHELEIRQRALDRAAA